jgi:hypothetical protein
VSQFETDCETAGGMRGLRASGERLRGLRACGAGRAAAARVACDLPACEAVGLRGLPAVVGLRAKDPAKQVRYVSSQ